MLQQLGATAPTAPTAPDDETATLGVTVPIGCNYNDLLDIETAMSNATSSKCVLTISESP